MDTKITFILTTKSEQVEHVISNLKRISGMDVMEDQNKKGDIVCVYTVTDDDVKDAVHTCDSIYKLGVDSVRIFTKTQPLPDPIPPTNLEKLKPFIPMICSTLVTFFLVFGAVYETLKNWTWVDMFILAGIPSVVTFLSQFALANEPVRIAHILDRRRNGG